MTSQNEGSSTNYGYNSETATSSFGTLVSPSLPVQTTSPEYGHSSTIELQHPQHSESQYIKKN